MSGVISSISIGGILTSVAGSVASSVIGGAINGGGGGHASTGGGGSGVQSNEQGFYANNSSNPFYGVNVSNKPMDGAPLPKNQEMPINKNEPTHMRVATAKETPTQDVGIGQSKQDLNDVWADRLSKYLDYNTRSLG